MSGVGAEPVRSEMRLRVEEDCEGAPRMRMRFVGMVPCDGKLLHCFVERESESRVPSVQ